MFHPISTKPLDVTEKTHTRLGVLFFQSPFSVFGNRMKTLPRAWYIISIYISPFYYEKIIACQNVLLLILDVMGISCS